MSSLSNKQVSVEAARQLKHQWDENQSKAIERVLGFEDVRDFLFDLDELQEYLEMVKKKSQEQGIQKPGIRLYFGAYSTDRRATVFLAPTKDNYGSGKQEEVEDNYEIEPLNTVVGGWPPRAY